MNSVARGHQFRHDFSDGARARSTTGVPGVLIQETVRDQNNLTAALIV